MIKFTCASTADCKNAFVSSDFNAPFSSNWSWEFAKYTSGCCTVGISKNANDWRKWWLAPNPDNGEIDCEAINAGFPPHTDSPHGRDATSNAFFNAAGTERLCSGVTNTIASCAATLLRNSVYSAGLFASWSWLYNGNWAISKKETSTSDGYNSAICFAHYPENEPSRIEPTIIPTFVIYKTSFQNLSNNNMPLIRDNVNSFFRNRNSWFKAISFLYIDNTSNPKHCQPFYFEI